MADRPTEYELLLSAYTQMGRDLGGDTDHLDAVVPSGVEEHELGFDIQIPYLKGVALQFKRPTDGAPRRFSVRYADQEPPRQLDRMRNWALAFSAGAAYYALPLVVEHDALSATLQRTAFVPATELHPQASVVRVPAPDDYVREGVRQERAPVTVYCSDPDDPADNFTETIAPSAVVGWTELKRQIGACTAAFRLRWDGEPCYESYFDGQSLGYRDDEGKLLASQFVEGRSPLLARIGSSDPFDW